MPSQVARRWQYQSPAVAHCADRARALLLCRLACWVPAGGCQTCIGIRPWTLGRGHRYPISSTPFADTVWYNRPIRHPLSWCFQHPSRLHPYRCLHLSRSCGGWIAGSIFGGRCFVLSWATPHSANPMAICILFSPADVPILAASLPTQSTSMSCSMLLILVAFWVEPPSVARYRGYPSACSWLLWCYPICCRRRWDYLSDWNQLNHFCLSRHCNRCCRYGRHC